MPNLEELSLRGVQILPNRSNAGYVFADLRRMTRLTILHLHDRSSIARRIYFPATLRDLRISHTGSQGPLRDPEAPEEPLTRLTNLVSIDLALIADDWPEYLAPNLMPTAADTNLSEIRLSVDPHHDGPVLQLLGSGSARKVRLLKLEGCQWLKDSHSTILTSHVPRLENLTLRAAAITGVFIMDLIKAPHSRLSKVLLTDCTAVSSDIIPWARARNVNLTIKRTDVNNGQRIRDAHY